MSIRKAKSFVIIILFLLILCLSYFQKQVFAEHNSNTAKIVMDTSSNRILFSKNIDEKMFIASTTKILTAITIIENCNINEIIDVKKNTVGIEGSSIYLKEGDKYSISDLLYGLMLRSGNDSAETLAFNCSNSIDSFTKLMNKTAKNIGTINSNFTNPHGLHNDNHYSCAYDLALITSYAMKNQIFRKIVSSKYHKITNHKDGSITVLKNKNKMLFEYEGATGIKTGYTKNAGRCLVSSAKRNEMELIAVVLNCPSMFEDSKKMLDDCFNKYSLTTILNKENIIGFTEYNNNKYCLYIKNNVILPLTENEKKELRIEYKYPQKLENLPKNDENIGVINFYIQNNLIFSEKIYTII